MLSDILALAAGAIPLTAMHACDKMQSSGKCENNCRTCAIIRQLAGETTGVFNEDPSTEVRDDR